MKILNIFYKILWFLSIHYFLDLLDPVISKTPQGPLERYTNAVLTCQVEGYPSPPITWNHRSLNLPQQQNATQYFIHNATSTDEGDYTCSVSNEASTKVTDPVTVVLNCKPLNCNLCYRIIRFDFPHQYRAAMIPDTRNHENTGFLTAHAYK